MLLSTVDAAQLLSIVAATSVCIRRMIDTHQE
jgi:hypothetical protein